MGWVGVVGSWVVSYPTCVMTSTASIDGALFVHILKFFFVKWDNFVKTSYSRVFLATEDDGGVRFMI